MTAPRILLTVKQQMVDQIHLVPEEQRDGYRLAIRTVAGTEFGKQHFWTDEVPS